MKEKKPISLFMFLTLGLISVVVAAPASAQQNGISAELVEKVESVSDAAYILGLEDKIGSLEQGKFADFAILEEDPFEVDPKRIENIKIWGTVLGGKPFKSKDQ